LKKLIAISAYKNTKRTRNKYIGCPFLYEFPYYQFSIQNALFNNMVDFFKAKTVVFAKKGKERLIN
jgi:hypothetical protein